MTPEEVAEVLADVREHLRRISEEDAFQRTRCNVCQAMTRSPERHVEIHSRSLIEKSLRSETPTVVTYEAQFVN